jgi:hypothetical protein
MAIQLDQQIKHNGILCSCQSQMFILPFCSWHFTLKIKLTKTTFCYFKFIAFTQ